MMNKVTRRLARIPDEVRTEIEPFFSEYAAIEDQDHRKFPKLPEYDRATSAKYVRTGLTVSFAHTYSTRLQVYILSSYAVYLLSYI